MPIRLTHVLEATAGGSRKHLRLIIEALLKKNYKIQLILSKRRADPDFSGDLNFYQESNVDLHLIDMAKNPSFNDLSVIQKVKKAIQSFSPEIVHSHCAKAGFISRLALKKMPSNIMSIHTPHSYFFEGFESSFKQKLGIKLERKLSQSGYILAISEAEKKLINRYRILDEDRVFLAENCLDEGIFESFIERDAVRQKFSLNDSVAIAMMSRLVKKKGHNCLIKAIAHLDESLQKKVKVLLFGTGPEEASIQSQIDTAGLSKTVLLNQYLPHAATYLKGMDIVVLPSAYEGLPYQLLEALAAGCPLIASDIPGNHLMHQNNPIQYFQYNDYQQLSSFLEDLIRDKSKRTKLGVSGIEYVKNNYLLDRQINQIEVAYRKVLNRAV